MNEIKIIGIDLAKSNFSLCGLSRDGAVVFRKTMKRSALIDFTSKLPPCLIGFEACGGSHYWGRLFEKQGHKVKMMSVYAVKAFAPPQKKNDTSDAQAIAVAASQSSVLCVRIKPTSSQDLDAIRNLREQYMKQKVALINQAHAICLEFGLMLPKGKSIKFLENIFEVLEDANNELSDTARSIILEALTEAKELESKASRLEKKIESLAENLSEYKLLTSIPGVGTLTAAAVLSHTGGKVDHFKNGRQFAAYLGLVPRQYSTGGKTRLHRITKSGNQELRRLLVLGTRAVLIRSNKKSDRVNKWIEEKKLSKGYMKANIALANKTARIIYAVLKNQMEYQFVN